MADTDRSMESHKTHAGARGAHAALIRAPIASHPCMRPVEASSAARTRAVTTEIRAALSERPLPHDVEEPAAAMTFKSAMQLLHAAAATAVVGLIFVQLYLIGEYVYGDVSALQTHESVGKAVPFIELLVFLTALAGWWSSRIQVGLSLAFFLLGGIQVSFATTRWGTNPSVRALHPALAVAVVLLAAVTATNAWRLRNRLATA